MQSLLNRLSYYQIYGVTLSSNIPLPILIPSSSAETADINIHLTESECSAPCNFKEDCPGGWYRQQKADGIYHRLLLYSSKERLEVEIAPNGQQIWMSWINLPLAEVTAILIGCVLGTALRLQGKICLHSSVIAVDNGAIAIVGAKGAGKSTTAAVFAKQGYSVLADDIAVLTDCDDVFLVQPGYPRLRLWKSAVDALYGSSESLSRVFSQTDKHFVELNQSSIPNASSWRFFPQPLPLKAIYILGERQQSLASPHLEVLIPQFGLMHLITHIYPQSLKLERNMQAREFTLLGRLATAVPMLQLHRRDSLSELPNICEVMLSNISETIGGCLP
jgi:hypothetical protein